MTGQIGKITLSVGMGIGFGLVVHMSGHQDWTQYVKPLGSIFLSLLKMIIIPLVLSSIYLSILNLGDPANLGRMGRKTILLFLITTIVAVSFGMFYGLVFAPGENAALINSGIEATQSQGAVSKSLWQAVSQVMVDAVPANPAKAMAENNILQLIVFAIFLGLVGLYHQEKVRPFTELMKTLEYMSHQLTKGVMRFAPIGVLALLIDVVANSGLNAMAVLGKYMGVVLLGLLSHFVFLMILAKWKTGISFKELLGSIGPALLTAFSTSSSAATLPVTMECVTEDLKVREKTANFVLPLGSTVNMDGTALYIAVAALFIAQVYGIHLSIAQLLVMFVTTILAAVGAAAIPGASMVTIGIVLTSSGLPIEGVQIILAVDRLLDMFRTTINVMGDMVVASIVDDSLKKEGH